MHRATAMEAGWATQAHSALVSPRSESESGHRGGTKGEERLPLRITVTWRLEAGWLGATRRSGPTRLLNACARAPRPPRPAAPRPGARRAGLASGYSLRRARSGIHD